MANLKGTFLSDERMLEHCEIQKIPNLAKTYNVLGNIGGHAVQAPVNPKAYLRQLAEVKGQSYDRVKDRYFEAMKATSNTSVSVVSMSPMSIAERLRDAKAVGTVRVSRPIIQPVGVVPAGTTQVGGTQVVVNQGAPSQQTLLGGGIAPLASQFMFLNKRDQMRVFGNLLQEAKASGFTTTITKSLASQSDKPRREALFNDLLRDAGSVYDEKDVNDFM